MRDDWAGAWRLALRLGLAHHPTCGWFAEDVYRVRGVAWCRGCVAMWPAFVVGVVAAVLALRQGAPATALLAASLVGGIPQATTYLHRWAPALRAAAKVLGGLGFGAAVLLVFVGPFGAAVRLGAGATLVVGTLGGLALRMRAVLRVCRACPWKADWDACPGFDVDQGVGSRRAPPPPRSQAPVGK